MMKINAAFNRSQGQAISILSVILPPSEKRKESILVIAKEQNLSIDRDSETALIVDNPLQENNDMLFTHQHFQAAFEAWQNLNASQRVIIENDLNKHNPSHVLETIGRKENGKGEINIDTLSNGHMAILATCLFFYQQLQIEKTTGAFEYLTDLYHHQLSHESYSKESDIAQFFMTI